MIERHFPAVTANRWGKLVRDEIQRSADPSLAFPLFLENMEVLLYEAGKKIKAASPTPRILNLFPLIVFKPLWRLVVLVFEFLFHNQRAINTLLLQALQESLSVIRSLAPAAVTPETLAGSTSGEQ
jgi:hypothetical protein